MIAYSAIVVAAGKGERMGLGYNKVYLPMEGRTLLEKTLDVFETDPDCKEIVLVTDELLFQKYCPNHRTDKLKITAGGTTRQQSVSNGLLLVTGDVVMIHDGARPYVSKQCLNSLKQALEIDDAACLMVPVKDTIKIVKEGYIQETIPRETLMAAQTPQVFRTSLLKTCMKKAEAAGYVGTDDCSLVEHFSDTKIYCVLGDYANKKITTPEDIQ